MMIQTIYEFRLVRVERLVYDNGVRVSTVIGTLIFFGGRWRWRTDGGPMGIIWRDAPKTVVKHRQIEWA